MMDWLKEHNKGFFIEEHEIGSISKLFIFKDETDVAIDVNLTSKKWLFAQKMIDGLFIGILVIILEFLALPLYNLQKNIK